MLLIISIDHLYVILCIKLNWIYLCVLSKKKNSLNITKFAAYKMFNECTLCLFLYIILLWIIYVFLFVFHCHFYVLNAMKLSSMSDWKNPTTIKSIQESVVTIWRRSKINWWYSQYHWQWTNTLKSKMCRGIIYCETKSIENKNRQFFLFISIFTTSFIYLQI